MSNAEPASRTPPVTYNGIVTPIAVPLCGKMETPK